MNTRRDTHRQRLRQASRPLSASVRHLAPYPRLHLYRLDMPPGLPLYAPDTSSTARALVGQTFPTGPAYWKLERGWGGNLHLHIISPLPPLAVPGAAHHAPVYDLRGLLAYLSKPSPAELCAPGRLTPWTPDPYTRARAYRDALDEYAAARRDALVVGRRRLSPLSGWVGTRRNRPPAPPLLLVLDVLRFMLAATLTDPANSGPGPEPRPTPGRPLPGPYERPWGHVLAHPPPRIGQVQAR